MGSNSNHVMQNHTSLVKGFMGQTTSFERDQVKANVLVLGENKTNDEARYIHGIKGKVFLLFMEVTIRRIISIE